MPDLTIDALGTPVRVSGEIDALRAIAADWSRCVRPEGSTDAGAVSMDAAGQGKQASTPWLASRLTREGIERLAGRQLLFHACGLSLDDGRVLVLVGPSGAGKSTASVALCRRGFGYVSDETVAIDADFSVTPYPKPLLIRNESISPKDVVGPDELGLARCADALAVTRLVLLQRDGTALPQLSPVSLVDAILALVPESSALARLDSPLASVCRLVDRCGGVRALHYSEISDAEPLLRHLMDDAATASQQWVQLRVAPQARPGGLDSGVPWFVASPVQDAVQVGDEVLLLHNSRPVRLLGIGATLWLSCRVGATLGGLRDAVTAAHGHHPDAERLVAAAVEEMVEMGVVEADRP